MPPQIRYIPLSIVTSNMRPQPGQNNRSSGNTSTEEAPAGTSGIYWEVLGKNAQNIQFDVKQDVSGGSDPTHWNDVRSTTFTSHRSFRRVYIANPVGASDRFVVIVWATLQGPPSHFNITGMPLCGIRSAGSPQSGQQNRSSGDFTTQEALAGAAGLRWSVLDDDGSPQPGVAFNIMEDVSGGKDGVIHPQVRHGAITKYVSDRQLYIANPTGASGHFFVMAHVA